MFLDRVKIFVSAGAGGDGAATFRREAHVPRGGPDGGDGGRGGSVYLKVDAGQTTLRDFRFRHHFKATPGGRGERARRHGAAGEDVQLEVPPGTAVYDDDTGILTVTVSDGGRWRLVATTAPPPGHCPQRGRGVPLMRVLTDGLQIDNSERGTQVSLVWADLR